MCHQDRKDRPKAQGLKVQRQDFEEGSIEWQILELLEDLAPGRLLVGSWSAWGNCSQERVKPFVQQDGGDIEFVRFDHGDGSLYLRMVGSCSGCAQSHATLQEGVKKLMDHYLPEVKQIVGLNDETGDDGMCESTGPRQLGLEGQDDPKQSGALLAQLKASVERLDPIALSKKYTECLTQALRASVGGRSCPICRAALKSIEGIRLLRVYSSDTENLEFPIPRPYRYDGVRERRRFSVPEASVRREMRRFALHWRIHNKVASHFNPRAAACEAAYEKLLSCSPQSNDFDAARRLDSGREGFRMFDRSSDSVPLCICITFPLRVGMANASRKRPLEEDGMSEEIQKMIANQIEASLSGRNKYIILAHPSMDHIKKNLMELDPLSYTEVKVDWREFESGMPNIFIEEVHKLLPAHVLLLLNMRRKEILLDQLSLLYAIPRYGCRSLTVLLPFFPTGTMEFQTWMCMPLTKS
eukprot:s1048_g1.t1